MDGSGRSATKRRATYGLPSVGPFSTGFVANGRTNSEHNPTNLLMRRLSGIRLVQLRGAVALDEAVQRPERADLQVVVFHCGGL
jgi:hypothetical protein